MFNNSSISGCGSILGDAKMYDSTLIDEYGFITGKAEVYNHVIITDNSFMKDNAIARGNVILTQKSSLSGNCKLQGKIDIMGNAHVRGNVNIKGDYIRLEGDASLDGDVKIKGNDITIKDFVNLTNKILILNDVSLGGDMVLDFEGTILKGVNLNGYFDIKANHLNINKSFQVASISNTGKNKNEILTFFKRENVRGGYKILVSSNGEFKKGSLMKFQEFIEKKYKGTSLKDEYVALIKFAKINLSKDAQNNLLDKYFEDKTIDDFLNTSIIDSFEKYKNYSSKYKLSRVKKGVFYEEIKLRYSLKKQTIRPTQLSYKDEIHYPFREELMKDDKKIYAWVRQKKDWL